MKLLVVFMSVVSALRFDMSKDGTDRPVASCEVRVTQFEKEDWPSGPFGLQVDIINSAQQLLVHTGRFDAPLLQQIVIKTPMKLDLIVWTSGFDASPVYFAFGHQGWSTSNNKECYYAMQDANWNGYRKIHCPFDCSKATVDETKKD